MGTVSLPITSRSSSDDMEFADVYANDLAIINQLNGKLDANNLADDAVGSDQIADGSVTAVELAAGLATGVVATSSATVATEQSTNSSSFTNLATAGPSVTVTIPANALVAVSIQADIRIFKNTSGVTAEVGLFEATDLSTAQQVLSGDGGTYETLYSTPESDDGTQTLHLAGELVFPATAGNRTYSLRYKRTGGSSGNQGYFRNRKLVVTVYDVS